MSEVGAPCREGPTYQLFRLPELDGRARRASDKRNAVRLCRQFTDFATVSPLHCVVSDFAAGDQRHIQRPA